MLNYLEILGEYYPTVDAWTTGDPNVYADIQFSGSPVISQAELDAVHLVDYKTKKIIYFSELAEEQVIAGFDSSALGTPHMYDSAPEDQLNLIGACTTGDDMYYAVRAYKNGYQIVDLGGTKVGTDPTGFANNNITHDCEIRIDGVSTYLSIQGQDAQTIDQLITQINNDLDFSARGTASLDNGNIKIESNTYNSSSSVLILDADLFNQMTGYVGVQSPVPGANAVDVVKEYKWHTHAQIRQVTQDGAAIKLNVLQKFNVKRQQITNAADEATVDLVTWD